MKAVKHTLVKFDEQAIAAYDKRDIGGGLSLVMNTDYNPADYAPEIAYIVSSPNNFFQPGDCVLVLYDAYIRGKTKIGKANNEASREIPDTDGVHQVLEHEIVAKIINYNTDGEYFLPKPGTAIIEGYVKPQVKKDDRKILFDLPKGIADYGTELITGASMSMEKLAKEIDLALSEAPQPWIAAPFWAKVIAGEILEDGYDPINLAGQYVYMPRAFFQPFTYKNVASIQVEDVMALSESPN